MDSRDPAAAQPSAAPPVDAPGLLEAAAQLLDDMQGLLQLHWQLLALEARRAAWGLVAIAAFSAATGLLLALGCLGLSAALALWLVELGLRGSLAVLLASLLNLVGVWGFLHAIRHEARVLGFPATRRGLRRLLGPGGAPP